MPGLLAPAIRSAALAKIPSKNLLRCCLNEVEAEVWLQIIPEPDCTRVVLANLVLLELHSPPLFWPLIELSQSLKKQEKHTVAPDVSYSVGMHLLLGCVDLLSTTGKMASDGMLLMQKDPTLGIPTLRKFLCILLEIAAICSKKCIMLLLAWFSRDFIIMEIDHKLGKTVTKT